VWREYDRHAGLIVRILGSRQSRHTLSTTVALVDKASDGKMMLGSLSGMHWVVVHRRTTDAVGGVVDKHGQLREWHGKKCMPSCPVG